MAFANAQRVASFTVASGGTGYVSGDLLAVSGGTSLFLPTSPTWGQQLVACAQVATVGGTGNVLTVDPVNYGAYSTPPSTPAATVGGTGSGATLTLTFALYWRNSTWIVPTVYDLLKVISLENLKQSNQNTDQAAFEGDPKAEVDMARPNRASDLLTIAVNRVRAAITTSGRYPLSITAASIPPGALIHALNLAAFNFATAKPDLASKMLMDPSGMGGKAPLVVGMESAQAWIKGVSQGKIPVEYPSDPDPSWQPAVRLGAASLVNDMNTTGASMSLTDVPVSLGTL